jgi:hypothetical protein
MHKKALEEVVVQVEIQERMGMVGLAVTQV